MKTKILLAAALIGAAAFTAQAGVGFGFSFGFPSPAFVAPVAPVVVSPPTVYAPQAVVTIPAYPGPGYVWTPGYWSVGAYGRLWVPGCWTYGGWHGEWREGHDGWHRDRDYRDHDWRR